MGLSATPAQRSITSMPTAAEDITKGASASHAKPLTNKLKRAGKKAGSIASLQKAATPATLRQAISEPMLKKAARSNVGTTSKSDEVATEKTKTKTKKKKKKLGGAAGSAAAAAKLLAAGKRSKLSKTKVVAVGPPATGLAVGSGSICIQCSSLLGNHSSSMRKSLPALSGLSGSKGGSLGKPARRTTYDLIDDEFFIINGKVN